MDQTSPNQIDDSMQLTSRRLGVSNWQISIYGTALGRRPEIREKFPWGTQTLLDNAGSSVPTCQNLHPRSAKSVSRSSHRLDPWSGAPHMLRRCDLERKSEDAVRLIESGEIRQEWIRAATARHHEESGWTGDAHTKIHRSTTANGSDVNVERVSTSNLLPNLLPETPVFQEFGTLFGPLLSLA
jgi:hypothetical protein